MKQKNKEFLQQKEAVASTFLSHSASETFEWGKALGQRIQEPTVVCFFGDLAAGKTTLIKGLVCGFAQVDPAEVQSPTFTYMHMYEGTKKVVHFDLYRLRDADEFLSMGFDEYFEVDGVCCVEWSERIVDYLPPESISIHISHMEADVRSISMYTMVKHA